MGTGGEQHVSTPQQQNSIYMRVYGITFLTMTSQSLFESLFPFLRRWSSHPTSITASLSFLQPLRSTSQIDYRLGGGLPMRDAHLQRASYHRWPFNNVFALSIFISIDIDLQHSSSRHRSNCKATRACETPALAVQVPLHRPPQPSCSFPNHLRQILNIISRRDSKPPDKVLSRVLQARTSIIRHLQILLGTSKVSIRRDGGSAFKALEPLAGFCSGAGIVCGTSKEFV